MECLNKLLKKVKSGLIIALMLMMCTTMSSFAADPTQGALPSPAGETTLPHIDMKVKQVKVGDATQVLVECWASKINNLSEIDITFTYNKTILQPSYINGENANQILEGIDTIKWETRPDAIDPSTHLSLEQEQDYMNRNKNLLSNSFEFKNGYEDYLDIFVFQYLATDEDNEALQFVTKNKTADDISDITDEVLIGTFSFRKVSDAEIGEETGTFSTKYIAITSDNNEDGWDIRDVTGKKGDTNCEELVNFIYEKYGSISGTITTSIKDENGNELNKQWKNPTATIKLYKKDDVEISKWSETGTNYINCKMDKSGVKLESKLPEPCKEPTIMQTTDNGEFKIEEVEFGEYVILIDKDYYADVIITNLVVSSENKDIDLVEKLKDVDMDIINDGVINLIPGDIDNDGKMSPNTDPILYKNDAQRKKESEINLDETITRPNTKNGNTDAIIFKTAANQYKTRNKQTIKRVINL